MSNIYWWDEVVAVRASNLVARFPGVWWLAHFGHVLAWRRRRTYVGIWRVRRLRREKKHLGRLVAWSRPGEFGPVEWMLDGAKVGLYKHAGWDRPTPPADEAGLMIDRCGNCGLERWFCGC
jgi:hypothetical protein